MSDDFGDVGDFEEPPLHEQELRVMMDLWDDITNGQETMRGQSDERISIITNILQREDAEIVDDLLHSKALMLFLAAGLESFRTSMRDLEQDRLEREHW